MMLASRQMALATTLVLVAVIVASASAAGVRFPVVRNQVPAHSVHKLPPHLANLARFTTAARAVVHSGVGSEESTNAPAPTLALAGDILPIGIFYTYVSVGSPAQQYKVAVDTGSSDLLLPAVDCDGCMANGTRYDPTKSTTSEAMLCSASNFSCVDCIPDNAPGSACGFANVYSTCDLTNETAKCYVSGPVYTDVLAVSEAVSAPVGLGVITMQSDNFQQFKEVPGIFGMAYQAMSQFGSVPPFQHLVDDGLVDNIFGLCINGTYGTLMLGEIDEDALAGPVMFTPIVRRHWYEISFSDIQVDGLSIGLNASVYTSQRTIVDSGTNVFTVQQIAFDAILSDFLALTANNSQLNSMVKDLFAGSCLAVPSEYYDDLPFVSIILDGDVNLTISAHQARRLPLPAQARYLVPSGSDGTVCLGIASSGKDPTFNIGTIIGDVNVSGVYYVVFDRTNDQVGFAPLKPNGCAM